MTTLASLRTRIAAEQHGRPQVQADLELSLREVEYGLGRLAARGYLFHLVPGPQPPEDHWPKLVFHATSAPNGRVVASEWELAELGPDWYPTLELAQHAAGVKTQFAGRGGLGAKGLPVAKGAKGPESADPAARTAANAKFISVWKDQHR